MKYCSGTTTTHSLVQSYKDCVYDLNTLIIQEGHTSLNPLFTNSEVVINLDIAESVIASLQKRKQSKSMDMAIGLRSSDSITKEMLMVEFKFNMTDFYFLKKVDLEGKVQGSSIILSNIPPIHNKFIFIFKTNHLQEAKNRIARMIPTLNPNYIPMDMQELKLTYF